MVHWTAEEKAAITSTWAKVDLENDGHNALTRLLLVYPWTQRYFSSFGNLSNCSAIAGNAKVHAHGKTVLGAINNAVHHLDAVKHVLADLSKQHAVELYVDPENFKRFGEVLIIVLASKLGSEFSSKVQSAWEKFINQASSWLSLDPKIFKQLWNLSIPAAVDGNTKVQAHAKKVLAAIDNAIYHLDEVKHVGNAAA